MRRSHHPLKNTVQETLHTIILNEYEELIGTLIEIPPSRDTLVFDHYLLKLELTTSEHEIQILFKLLDQKIGIIRIPGNEYRIRLVDQKLTATPVATVTGGSM